MDPLEETARKIAADNREARQASQRRLSRLSDAISGEGDFTETAGKVIDESVRELEPESEADGSEEDGQVLGEDGTPEPMGGDNGPSANEMGGPSAPEEPGS